MMFEDWRTATGPGPRARHWLAMALVACGVTGAAWAQPVLEAEVRNRRILVDPYNHPDLPSKVAGSWDIADNKPGWEKHNLMFPTLVHVPDWAAGKLGKYYLYASAHHGNNSLMLFYSDRLEGPYRAYYTEYAGSLGTRNVSILPMEESIMNHHIAAPDVHVDAANNRFMMFYHGRGPGPTYRDTTIESRHTSSVAFSDDGIHWKNVDYHNGCAYPRAFEAGGRWFGFCRLGRVYNFEGPQRFGEVPGYGDWHHGSREGLVQMQVPHFGSSQDIRHPGAMGHDTSAFLLYTRFSDGPERIKMTFVKNMAYQRPDDEHYSSNEEALAPLELSNEVDLMRPFYAWEGANDPVGEKGSANQLRTPQLFPDRENNRYLLLYAFRGEGGIAMADIRLFVDGKELLPNDGWVAPSVPPGKATEIIHPCIDCPPTPGSTLALEGRGLELQWSYSVDGGKMVSAGTGDKASLDLPAGLKSLRIVLEGKGGRSERAYAFGGGNTTSLERGRPVVLPQKSKPNSAAFYDLRGSRVGPEASGLYFQKGPGAPKLRARVRP